MGLPGKETQTVRERASGLHCVVVWQLPRGPLLSPGGEASAAAERHGSGLEGLVPELLGLAYAR